jgi:hypothetical protein
LKSFRRKRAEIRSIQDKPKDSGSDSSDDGIDFSKKNEKQAEKYVFKAITLADLMDMDSLCSEGHSECSSHERDHSV